VDAWTLQRFNDLTRRYFPRNLAPDFTQYFSERTKMSSQEREFNEGELNNMKTKIISTINAVKRAFDRLRRYIYWMRYSIKMDA
jgi:hypothetical protein